MLTSDTRFLLKNFLSPTEIENTFHYLCNDPFIKSRTYSVIGKDSEEFYIFNAAKNLFSPKTHMQMLAKGIVFHSGVNGVSLVSVPFTKFYNSFEGVAQRDLENTSGLRMSVARKQDGTLIQRFVHEGHVYFTTRSMIINLENPNFKEYVNSPQYFFDLTRKSADEGGISKYLFDPSLYADKTLIFELVGPSNQILEAYPRDELVLIGAVDKPGLRYIPYTEFKSPFSETKRYSEVSDLNTLINNPQESTLHEGYVVEYHTETEVALRVKVKTSDYLALLKLRNNVSLESIFSILEVFPTPNFEMFFSSYEATMSVAQQVFREEIKESYRVMWEENAVSDAHNEYVALLNRFVTETTAIRDNTKLTSREQYEACVQVAPAYASNLINYVRRGDYLRLKKSSYATFLKLKYGLSIQS